MKWRTLDYREIRVPHGSKLGVIIKDKGGKSTKLGGYEFTLSTSSKQYSLRIAATESFSSTIKTKKEYEKLCNKVVELTESNDVYNKIGEPWRRNNNICFVIVYKKKIMYRSDWRESKVWHWTLTENLDMIGTKTILWISKALEDNWQGG